MFEIFCLLGFYLFIWYQVSSRSTHFQLTLIGCYQHKQIFLKMPRVDSFNLFFMLLLIKIWWLLLCFIYLMLYVHFWACSSWQYMVALTFPSHVQFSSVHFSCSVVSNSLQPHELQHARPPCPSPTPGPPKPMSIELVMPSNHLILCHPLLLPPSVFPSIRVFSNESALWIRWPKYWSFSFNTSPSNEHSGLIFFRMDWLDLLAVQGTLKSLLQHHSSEASVLRHSAFFIVQLSHPVTMC